MRKHLMPFLLITLLLTNVLAGLATAGGGPGRPSGGSGAVATPDGFPMGFQTPVSRETGRPVGGWGCDSTGQTDGGSVNRVPVLFVHGNARDAHDWDQVRSEYINQGYSLCETWAVSYGRNNPWHWDTNAAGAQTLQEFVNNMLIYIQTHKNPDINQVDIVAHSLGGTVVRHWLKTSGQTDLVHAFISIASPHHGISICRRPDGGVCDELTPGSDWLANLNSGSETPGAIRYLTLYDGTGRYDQFYAGLLKDSPALDGATNYPVNAIHGTQLDHIALKDQTVNLQIGWLQGS